jgi:hypothetical protein
MTDDNRPEEGQDVTVGNEDAKSDVDTTPRRDVEGIVCITIVVESLVEQRILDGLTHAGARGWTVTSSRGLGPRHIGVTEIEGGSIRIEVLATVDVANQIWELLHADYFPHYSVAAWEYPVTVSRMERYGGDVTAQ